METGEQVTHSLQDITEPVSSGCWSEPAKEARREIWGSCCLQILARGYPCLGGGAVQEEGPEAGRLPVTSACICLSPSLSNVFWEWLLLFSGKFLFWTALSQIHKERKLCEDIVASFGKMDVAPSDTSWCPKNHTYVILSILRLQASECQTFTLLDFLCVSGVACRGFEHEKLQLFANLY